MCGRFENRIREEWMMEKFAEFDLQIIFKSSPQNRKKENIAPTDSILTLFDDNDKLFSNSYKWGIKFSDESPLIFNSRIETISNKQFWKTLFDKNRCIVPMSAFYEWKKEKTKKVPYRIFLKNEEMFFVPAIYFKDKNGNILVSLITTEPNDFMKNIHNRMPVILEMEEAINFLSNDFEENFKICIPFKKDDIMDMEHANI